MFDDIINEKRKLEAIWTLELHQDLEAIYGSEIEISNEKSNVKILRELFRIELEDPDLMMGYQANVAMLLHDRYGITDHDERNKAAEDILKLIFWS